jgi:translation initiation factor 2 gamma subunit (eIF-2gamma)
LGIKEHLKVEQIKIKEMLMLSINTTITLGNVEKISKDKIEFALNIPVIALEGDKVGIARNINGHWRLIGFGKVL